MKKALKSVQARLSEEAPIILDGAMGTELFRRGVKTKLPSWSAHALVHQPELVREIHEDYIRAGAEIITTNTFRTSYRSLNKECYGSRAKELTELAVTLAKEARSNSVQSPVWIAGSVAPLEDCYEPELVPDMRTAAKEHAQMIDWLTNSGVDLILIETMNSIEEALVAAESAAQTGLPFFVSWTCTNNGTILGGQSLEEGVRALLPYHPSAFLVNCTPAVHLEASLSRLLKSVGTIPVGAYANIGKPEPVFGWEFTDELDAEGYSRLALNWISAGAKIVGGCCGTSPDYIRSIIQRLKAI
jgi:S-methylmethionine-dependent homocysteine/selenocysteine methylase